MDHPTLPSRPGVPSPSPTSRLPGTGSCAGSRARLASLAIALLALSAAAPAASAATPGRPGQAAPAAPEQPAHDLAAVVRAAEAAGGELAVRLAARIDRWRKLVPAEDIHWELDPERKLVFASAIDDADLRARIRAEAAAVVDAAVALCFGEPPADPVLVVVAGAELADRLVAPEANVGGRYVHVDRMVAVREVGVSLRHELVHALHFAHMERMGMREAHAFWIQEGLAALFETWDPVPGGDGTTPPPRTFTTNDRDAIAHRLADVGALDALTELAALDGRGFMRRARRHYAVARAAMRWLEDRGVLAEWYRRLGDRPGPGGGIAAMADVLGLEPAALDEAFRAWLRAHPPPPTERRPGGAWIGIERFDGDGTGGLRILRFARGGPARVAGLRQGDVLLELDGALVPTEPELERLLAKRRPGETVRLTLRRRGQPLILPLELAAWDPSPTVPRGRRR